jgi:hypothetical protein
MSEQTRALYAAARASHEEDRRLGYCREDPELSEPA